VPRGFLFAVKASRYLAHLKRLRDPADPLQRLLSRARRLEGTLGPGLFQLPGHFQLDIERLDVFLAALTRQRHVQGLRSALEVRHPSWLDRAALDLLENAGVALCLADWKTLPVTDVVTADFVYVRRHGASRRYAGSYPLAALREDARRIRAWRRGGRDVCVYFNNDQRAYAVQNALKLLKLSR
jgi:uncharacterized protein YecE (DUF72 family)